MRQPTTFTLLAACLAAAMPPAAARAAREASQGLDVRYVHLLALPAALASDSGSPSAHSQIADAASNDTPLVAWVQGASLATVPARAEALAILDAGIPLLVTANPGEPRYESATFGVGASETTALYQPLANGTLHMHLFDDTASGVARGQVAQRVVDDALRRIVAQRQLTLERKRRDTRPSNHAGGDMAPTKVWSASRISAHGASMALTVTVTRDVSALGDSKVITVKADAEVVPYANGLTAWPRQWDLAPPFVAIPRTPTSLVVPTQYSLHTLLRWAEATHPGVRLAAHHPMTDGTTDRTINDTHTTRTSWGVGVSPEVSSNLAAGNVTTAGKVPASLTFGREHVDQQSVQMTLKDFSTAYSPLEAPGVSAARWTFALANDITADRSYFNSGLQLGEGRMTPMMRRANLQAIATWRVNGDFEGKLQVDGVASVRNRIYRRDGRLGFSTAAQTRDTDDCRGPKVIAGCALIGLSTLGSTPRPITNTSQPVATVEIDLASPYLTRSPTVLLQTLGHPNQCIAQAGNLVFLQECDRSEGATGIQWTFDALGRYVNRKSGLCLQVIPSDGHVAAQECSASVLQQWEWRADRIHSRFEGGRHSLRAPSRLDAFAQLTAMYRPSQDDVLPVNPTNALLPPWSSYPLAPRAGDYVPGFNFTAASLPSAHLRFGDVDGTLRWATIPLLPGLR